MANIDEKTAQACNISPEILGYLRIVDVEKAGKGRFIMIGVVPGAREKWLKNHESEQKGKNAENAETAVACPLDSFPDGGWIFFTKTDEESGAVKAFVVCEGISFPKIHPVTPNTASHYISELFKDTPKVLSRKWEEGSVLIMATVEIDGEVHSFVASRRRIKRLGKWTNEPGCPTVDEALNEVATAQGIRLENLRVPGQCHQLLLRHPYNQILETGLEKPELYHLGTWSFDEKGCKRIPDFKIEGALKMKPLSHEEASEVVKAGGVVLREHPDGSTEKLMLASTALAYRWMTENPVEQAFLLRAKNMPEFQRYYALLRGQNRAKVDKAFADMEKDERAAAEYILARHWQTIRKGAKVHPKLESKLIDIAVGYLRYKYGEAKSKAIESGKFKTESRKPKGKKPEKVNNKKQKKPVFHLGRTPEASKEAEIKIILDHILALREKNPTDYCRLIRKCARFAKQEEFYARKARGEVKEGEKEPADESDDEIFIPEQYPDTPDLEDYEPKKKWGDQ